MRRLFLLLVLFFGFSNLKAQYFQTGQDPASIKWRQINTENFQLIYPDYYELQAQKLAWVMEKVYAYGSKSMQHKPKKISIILHTQTVQSNGLVAWAPKRSEFYTIPHQGMYPQKWLEQLATHEFRHVVQIDKINSEIPKIIKIVLGEQGTALVFGAYLPWWFIEGDAVVTETAMSNFGRGRFPSFLMEHRAQVVEKGVYKYDKAYNGSVKDFVPDHYKLGYYLVGTAREKYGVGVWDSVLTRVGTKPFSLNPFNKALKNQTGLNKVQLYNSVFKELEKKWIEEDRNYTETDFKQVSKKNKTFTNYRYNHWLNDSVTVSYKTSLNTIPAFISIDKDGNEKKLFKPGRIFDESVNYRSDWIIYSEQIPSLRWQHSGKSLICLYNINSKRKIEISPLFTAFSPSISPDLKKIIVVESDFSSNNYLAVYAIKSGILLHRIQTENNNYFFSPDWLNENEIVTIILTEKGKQLVKFNLVSGEMKQLTDVNQGEIKDLKVKNERLYFVSSMSGKNGLYFMDLNDNSIHRIYKPRFGAEYPAISDDGKNLIFSDYSANGFRLLKIRINEIKRVDNKNNDNYKLAKTLANQESGVLDLAETATVKYTSKKYKKAAHLINFHSWAPVSVDVNSYNITPGVSFMSQNKLGTSETILGYEWNVTEKTGKIYAKYTFKGWYPIFDFEINNGKRASHYQLIESNDDNTKDTTLQRFTWKETNVDLDVRIPFNFSRGKFYRLLQPEIKYGYTLYNRDKSTPEKFAEGNTQSMVYRLYYRQILRQSVQDVFPDFGWIGDIKYYHSPFGQTDLGSMFLGQTVFYFPGVMANHGIRFYAGYQDKKSNGIYGFSDAIRYPRGWGRISTTEMSSFAFDYKLPLFYPEWSAGGVVYLKRVNASLFADYANLKGNYYENRKVTDTFTSKISSYGIELTGDMHFLRFYAPVEMGFRASYLPEDKHLYFDFLLSIDFNSL
jgi:Tol biopolymer transport system component